VPTAAGFIRFTFRLRLAWSGGTFALVLFGLLALFLPASPTSAHGDDAASPEQQLAEKYAPVAGLKTQQHECDSDGEPYLPSPVEVVLGDPKVTLKQNIEGGSSRTDPVVTSGPTASDLQGLGPGYYLDFPGNPRKAGCNYESWGRQRIDGLEPTVYARLYGRDGQLALQYWFFYVFNDFNNKHEGDWEMIQLVFDEPDARRALLAEPISMALSQHGGGETASWDTPKVHKDGSHPIVFPAAGSHANQYSNGTYLGWGENGTGFGCDVATAPTTFIPLTAVLLPDTSGASGSFGWLSFEGRWGERQGGEYNGPTGPATKRQWRDPFEWQSDLRESSLKVPESSTFGPGPTGVFCAFSTYGSVLFTDLATNALGVFLFVIGVFAAITGLAFMTRRTISRSFVLYRHHWRTFVLIGLVLIPVGLLFNAVQFLVAAIPPTSYAVALLNEHNNNGSFASSLIVGVGQHMAGLAIVGPAVIEAFRRIESNEPLNVIDIYRTAFQKFSRTARAVLLAVALVVPLTLVVIGIPIAIWLLVRWFFAPQAVMLDGREDRDALRRSAESVGAGWHWLRTAGSGLLLFVIGAAPGPLIGLAFLILRSSSVSFANFVSSFVYAAFVPFAFLGVTILYRQRQVRLGVDPDLQSPSSTPEAAPQASGR